MSGDHHCLPLPAQPCQSCGEMIPPPEYCGTCGENIAPPHICPPRPLQHVCGHIPPPVRCVACGESHPPPEYCVTCGADITPSHHCSAAPPTHVHRSDPVHACPSLSLPKCDQCGQFLPAMTFCTHCGAETTPAHICQPQPTAHTCPPVVTMPRRCSSCGEVKPAPQHCTQCGANITPAHTCATEEPA